MSGKRSACQNFSFCPHLWSPSTNIDRYRNTGSVIIAKITISIANRLDISVFANKWLTKSIQNSQPITMDATRIACGTVIGFAILYKIIKPTIATRIVHEVETHAASTPNSRQKITSPLTTAKSVSPAGSAFTSTFVRKCPRIWFLFGSNARKNDGIPIVNILIKDTWDGSNG